MSNINEDINLVPNYSEYNTNSTPVSIAPTKIVDTRAC